MYFFRTEAGNDIGFAHLHRLSLIAQALVSRGLAVKFLVARSDGAQQQFLSRALLPFEVFEDADAYGDEVGAYDPDSLLFLDVQHVRNLRDPSRLHGFLRRLQAAGVRVVFLDALFQEAYQAPDDVVLYAVVQPYVGAENDRVPVTDHWLAGAAYAVLPPRFLNVPPKRIDAAARRVLVSFGGADPQGISAQVLAAFAADTFVGSGRAEAEFIGEDAPTALTFKVTIGPYFSEGLSHQLEQQAAALCARGHGVELVRGATDLLPLYDWADIAVGSSGLTRYELACVGVPAIYCSIYPHHNYGCELYAETGVAEYLGFYDQISPVDWAQAIRRLLGDAGRRAVLSQKGQALIDAKGIERILSALHVDYGRAGR